MKYSVAQGARLEDEPLDQNKAVTDAKVCSKVFGIYLRFCCVTCLDFIKSSLFS